MKNKTILFAMPKDYSLSKLIIKNLELLGLNVVYINPGAQDNTDEFRYESSKQRLVSFYKKIISGNKNYKNKLRQDFYFKSNYKKINTSDSYEYCLFIRADFFDDDIIELCKSKSEKIIAFHYDGVNRNKEIFNKVNYFDSFFVFDKDDLKINSSFKFISNFYFDYPEEDKDKTIEHDFYFLGSHHNSRKDNIFKLHKKLSQISKKVKFEIVFDKPQYNEMPNYKKENIICLPQIIDYELYLENTKKSKIIIDLVINEHNGLSFRVFESLKYRKKLITTNKTVKNYPFYNENNILILDESNFDEISIFLQKPFIEINESIIKTYSFTNWFQNLYNIRPYTKIK